MGFAFPCGSIWNHIFPYKSDIKPIWAPLLLRIYVVSIQTYIGGRFVIGGGADRASRVPANELAVGPHGTQGGCARVGRRTQDALLGARAEGDSCLSATLTRVTSWSSGVTVQKALLASGPVRLLAQGLSGWHTISGRQKSLRQARKGSRETAQRESLFSGEAWPEAVQSIVEGPLE